MVWMMFTASCKAKEPLQIVTDGKSAYRIVLPQKPAPNERKAAAILQQYLSKMTGASLPVISEETYKGEKAILVGKTMKSPGSGTEQVKYDGFYIATDDANLYIRGASGKGVLYGVYTFLEQYLGCRKYADGMPVVVPERKDVSIPAGIRDVQSPQFVFRQSYYPASNDPEYLDWHKLHRFEDLWGLWGHSYFRIIPPENYFAAHPEYFSLIQGRRQAVQLCLANEEVFRLTVDYLRKAIREKPDAIYWSVSPNDEPLSCTCPACRKADEEEGGPQGSLIRFVNRIAAAFPDQQFTTLAYTFTAKPPLRTKPASNVYILLSSIDAYRTGPLSTEPSAAAFRKNLQGWKAVSGHIFIWDYTTQFTNFLTPFPDYMNQQENFRYFKDKGVTGVFLHGSEDSYGDMAEMNSYLQAKLLWKPSADAQAVKEDFLSGYYGAAGKFVGQYLDALHDAVRSTGARLDIYGNPVNNHNDYLSPELIDHYSSLLDQAEAAVEDQPELLKRVARVRLSLEYVVLQQSAFYGPQQHGYLAADEGGDYKVRSGWRERVARFAAQCREAGVKELSEGGLSPEAYLEEWKELFAHSWKPNRASGADVRLDHSFSSDYPARGVQTLTDGITGGKDYSSNWLLFYGRNLGATLDMHEAGTFHSVTAGFLYDPRHFIFLPAEVRLELSEDGVHYREAGLQIISPPDEDVSAGIKRYTFRLAANGYARYIRLRAVCPATLPAWRPHETKKPAIACDEIFVE